MTVKHDLVIVFNLEASVRVAFPPESVDFYDLANMQRFPRVTQPSRLCDYQFNHVLLLFFIRVVLLSSWKYNSGMHNIP